MTYEAWRISYQSSEQAARAAYAELDRLRAENEALRADARRWRTLAPLFRGVSLHMNGTAHFMLPGGAIKPRARTVADAVDAMAPNAELSGAGSGAATEPGRSPASGLSE